MRGRVTPRSTQPNYDFSGVSSSEEVLDGIGDAIEPHERRRIDQYLQRSVMKQLQKARGRFVEVLRKSLILKTSNRSGLPVEFSVSTGLRDQLDLFIEVGGVATHDDATTERDMIDERVEDFSSDRVVGDVDSLRILPLQNLAHILSSIVNRSIDAELAKERDFIVASGDADHMTSPQLCELHHEVTESTCRG